MKKVVAICFSLFFALTLGFSNVTSFVFADKTISTSIVTPSSYEEFCDLNSPIDFYRDENILVIAEADRVITFENNIFNFYSLSGYNVSKISYFDGFVLFLSNSRIYSLELESSQIIETPINVATYFTVFNNVLVSNPSNSVYYYEISKTELGLEFNISQTFNLGYNVSAMTLTQDFLYFFHEKKLYKFVGGSCQEIINNLPAERFSAFLNGKLYFTSPNGLYEVDANTGALKTLATKSSKLELGSVYECQGVFSFNQTLLVCDSALNAILQFDVKTSSFTDYAITSRSDAHNRVSSEVYDLSAGNDKIYALDNNAIKVYDTINNSHYSLSLTDLNGASIISVLNDYILLSSGSNTYLVKEENGALSKVQIKTDVSSFKNVTSICSYEDAFYFINNETISSNQYAVIYKLSLSTLEITSIGSIAGRGDLISADLFGKIYICVFDSSQQTYSVYSSKIDEINPALLFTTQTPPLSIMVDFETNVYTLVSGNSVLKYSNPTYQATSSQITLSQNLPSQISAKKICMLPTTNKSFALYEGFIVELGEELEIASPQKLKFPTEYKNELNVMPEVVTVNSGAKIFKIDLPSHTVSDEYFTYLSYEQTSTYLKFIKLYQTDRYYLVANADGYFVVRTTDAQVDNLKFTAKNHTAFVVSDVNTYLYPIVDDYFKNQPLSKNQEVTVVSTLEFNGVEYSLIYSGENQGYVASSMLKNSIATSSKPDEFRTASVGANKTSVYSDENLTNVIGELEEYSNVYIIEELDGVYKIYYNNSIGYIKSSSVVDQGYYSKRNLIVILVLFVGIFSTSIYLLKTRVFAKKN